MRELAERPEFLTPASPEGLRAVQITSDTMRDSEAIYCDTPSWSPDSRFFAFYRRASDDGTQPNSLWLCDTADDFAISPVISYQADTVNACLSPDGTCVYHVLKVADRLEVRRVALTGGAETVVANAPLPLGFRGCLSMSADGERLLVGAFLGDGKTEGAPWGAYIFEVKRGTHRVIEFGNGYRNMHCQYSHNPDPAFSHDILLNAHLPKFADGSWLTPPDGSWRWQNLPPPADDRGCAYTVVRDDGSNWRAVPLGRQPCVRNGGHNVWRGREYSVVSAAYDTRTIWKSPLFEATPMPVASPDDMLAGMDLPGAKVVDLTRKLPKPDSCHFAFDQSGRHFISDTDGYAIGAYSFVFVGTYVTPANEDPFVRTQYLILPRTSWKGQPAHPHPYLSPDGRFAVIQSDYSGRPQVNVVTQISYPTA
jgi:hypothetical protein